MDTKRSHHIAEMYDRLNSKQKMDVLFVILQERRNHTFDPFDSFNWLPIKQPDDTATGNTRKNTRVII